MVNTRILNEQLSAGNVTRAFVVGVGAYPKLPENVAIGRDLSTAAASAVAFCQWLTGEYRNLQAPLASVDLLLSPGTFEGPWCDGSVGAATIDNIKWYPAVPAGVEEIEAKILDQLRKAP